MEKLFLERRGAKYKISQNISNISPGKISFEIHRMICHSYLERAERQWPRWNFDQPPKCLD